MTGASRLNLVSAAAVDTIPAAMARAANTFVAASLADLSRALAIQASRPRGAAIAIDLIGHSTRDHHLLRLGSTIIDVFDLGVLRFFEDLAQSGILRYVNAACLRLIGCATATSPSGQRTMRLLASVLRIPVHGTRKPIAQSHYNEIGFDAAFHHLLVVTAPRRAPWLPLGVGLPDVPRT